MDSSTGQSRLQSLSELKVLGTHWGLGIRKGVEGRVSLWIKCSVNRNGHLRTKGGRKEALPNSSAFTIAIPGRPNPRLPC